MPMSREHYILRFESFDGKDTYVHCGDHQQDFLFCVVATHPDGTASVIDSGYRSEEEARTAWSEIARREARG